MPVRINNEKYVAFLDILGFRKFVENNDHDTIVKKYENAFVTSVQQAVSLGRYKIIEKDGQKTAVAALENAKVYSLLVSDSAVLWTDNVSPQSFVDIIVTVRQLVLGCFYTGFPVRGAITVGSVTDQYFKSGKYHYATIIGKAFAEAVELEKKQNWSGCIIDNKGMDALCRNDTLENADGNVVLEYIKELKWIVQYDVPLKDGEKQRMYVVDWVNAKKSVGNELKIVEGFEPRNSANSNKIYESLYGINKHAIEKGFRMHGKMDSLSEKDKLRSNQIIQNTIKFADFVNSDQ